MRDAPGPGQCNVPVLRLPCLSACTASRPAAESARTRAKRGLVRQGRTHCMFGSLLPPRCDLQQHFFSGHIIKWVSSGRGCNWRRTCAGTRCWLTWMRLRTWCTLSSSWRPSTQRVRRASFASPPSRAAWLQAATHPFPKPCRSPLPVCRDDVSRSLRIAGARGRVLVCALELKGRVAMCLLVHV